MMGLLLIFCTVPVFAENQSDKIPDTVKAEEVSAETVPGETSGTESNRDGTDEILNTEGSPENGSGNGKTADTGAVSDAEVTPEKEAATEGITQRDVPEAENVGAGNPVAVHLSQGAASEAAPEHHKYIKKNAEDDYTLTLNVKGMYDSETTIPKIDVLLIVDKSGSMDRNMTTTGGKTSRMDVLKQVVTKEGGLTDSILGNTQIDARMAVVTYSGSRFGGAYNDADLLQGWTEQKDTVNDAVKNIAADGGTNCEAGLRTGAEVLGNSRTDAKKFVIFLSDGEPNFYYANGTTDKFGLISYKAGTTLGSGSGLDQTAWERAILQVQQITGLEGFYTIGMTNDSNPTFLTELKGASDATKTGYYGANDTGELEKAFQDIVGDITEFTCRNVTITDALSEYVEIPGGTLTGHYNVTATKGETVTDITDQGTITVTLSEDKKTVTATFEDDFVLDKDTTYAVNFNVVPTRKAYDEYANSEGLYPHTGSADSDAPGKNSSSGKPGFYSNESATLTYTFGKTGEGTPQTVAYVEKPVVQVSAMQIPVTKVWKGVPEDVEKPVVTVSLYQDGAAEPYKTLQLTEDNQWKETFTYVAKGHTYTVKEKPLEGYESAVSGDITEGFTVTNSRKPSLTVAKKVTGAMGDKTKKFEITITLKDADGNLLEGVYQCSKTGNGGQQTDETVEVKNGTITVQLGHEDTFTLRQLPVGTEYQVVENRESAQGYEVQYQNSQTGTLQDGDQTVTVINHRDTVPITGISGMGSGWTMGILMLSVFAAATWIFGIVVRRKHGRRQ